MLPPRSKRDGDSMDTKSDCAAPVYRDKKQKREKREGRPSDESNKIQKRGEYRACVRARQVSEQDVRERGGE